LWGIKCLASDVPLFGEASCLQLVFKEVKEFFMKLDNTEVMSNVAQLPKREVLKLSDLENVSLSDINNMFGTWFETDHCDKVIKG
jgi:hypothetical protein